MRLEKTRIEGVLVVEPEPVADARGLFSRTFDADSFAAAGLPTDWPQCNTSFNLRRGTLRGLHYQADPKPEAKLVRCTRGRIFDVAVDIRPGSPTYLHWHGIELSADNRRALFIAAGLAHGFVTLEDSSEVFYQMGEVYDGTLARGLRWSDPVFAIAWPLAPAVISDRDAGYPDFRPEPASARS
jgi:dTDP-4-dehydrorhamnose 3,5-epimerase